MEVLDHKEAGQGQDTATSWLFPGPGVVVVLDTCPPMQTVSGGTLASQGVEHFCLCDRVCSHSSLSVWAPVFPF